METHAKSHVNHVLGYKIKFYYEELFYKYHFNTLFFYKKKVQTLLDLCVSSLHKGHTNLLYIIPILSLYHHISIFCTVVYRPRLTHI